MDYGHAVNNSGSDATSTVVSPENGLRGESEVTATGLFPVDAFDDRAPTDVPLTDNLDTTHGDWVGENAMGAASATGAAALGANALRSTPDAMADFLPPQPGMPGYGEITEMAPGIITDAGELAHSTNSEQVRGRGNRAKGAPDATSPDRIIKASLENGVNLASGVKITEKGINRAGFDAVSKLISELGKTGDAARFYQEARAGAVNSLRKSYKNREHLLVEEGKAS